MAMDEPIAFRLRALALCHTEHPADAVSALIEACGEILYPSFGIAGSLDVLRSTLDDVAALMVAKHGKQLGEVAQ